MRTRCATTAALLLALAAGASAEDGPSTALTPLPDEVFEGLCPPDEHPRLDRGYLGEVQALLATGSFEALEARLAALREAGASPGDPVTRYDHAIDALGEGSAQLPLLEAWCEARPDRGLPLLVRGMCRVEAAWEARGADVAARVTQGGWRGFKEQLELARADLERARELDPDDARAPANLIPVAMGQGWPLDATRALFDAAVQRDPRCFTAFDSMLTYLLPRWRGSREQVTAFAFEQYEAFPAEPTMGLLVVVAMQEQRGVRLTPDDAAKVRAEMRAALVRVVDAYPAWLSGVGKALEFARATQDRELELRCVRALAGAGVVLYQQRLAEMLNGLNPGYVETDLLAAARWFCCAATQGRATAAYNLGAAFHLGQGVPKDPRRAFLWTQRSAELGFPQGMRLLGIWSRHGRGCERDVARAREWLERAAAEGDAISLRELGISHMSPEDGEPDLAQAERWQRRAIDAGEVRAALELGVLLTQVGRHEEAVVLLRRARASRVPQAEELLRQVLGGRPELREAGDPE